LSTALSEGYARGRKKQKKNQKISTRIRGRRRRRRKGTRRMRRRRIFLVFVSLLLVLAAGRHFHLKEIDSYVALVKTIPQGLFSERKIK
jgi:hypothetical protein